MAVKEIMTLSAFAFALCMVMIALSQRDQIESMQESIRFEKEIWNALNSQASDQWHHFDGFVRKRGNTLELFGISMTGVENKEEKKK